MAKIIIDGVEVELGACGTATYVVNAPIGAIMIWPGPESTIPEGWHVCDGQNGTLDLRDQFPLAAGENHAVGETGGSEEVTLTVGQMPSHNHGLAVDANSINSDKFRYILDGATKGIAKGSAFGISTEAIEYSGSSQSHSNMPPYRVVLYIQKIGSTPSDYVTEDRVIEIVNDIINDAIEEAY